MFKIFSPLCLGAALSVALAAPAHALTLVSERTDAQGGAATNTVYLDADHLRIESTRAARGGEIMIYDAKAKRMLVLHPDRKTYAEMTEADLARFKTQGAEMQKRMQAHLANLPPERRKMVEDMMAQNGVKPGQDPTQRPTRNLKFTALGQKKTVNGFACEMYNVQDGDKLVERDCIAGWDKGLITKDDVSALMKFLESFTNAVGVPLPSVQAEMNRYPGFPVVRTALGPDGKTLHEETLKSLKRDAPSADLFTIPAGYTKQERPFGGPGGPHGPGGPRGPRGQ